MIKLENITKSFSNKKSKKTVLNNINFNIDNVGLYSILGENGSGKTTLLNIIGLLDQATDGKIEIFDNLIDNKNIKLCHDIRTKYISYVFQADNLFSDFTVKENLEIVCSDQEKVLEMLKFVSLDDKINVEVSSLSGGEKQRLAIGRALLKDVPILLLDEITANLDEINTIQIFELLKNISKSKIVILVTHDKTNALKYSNQIYEIINGSLNKVCQNNLYDFTPKIEINTSSKIKPSFTFKYGFRLIKNKIFLFTLNVLLLSASLMLLFVYLSSFKINLTDRIEEALKVNNLNNILVETEIYNDNTNSIVNYHTGEFIYSKYKKFNPNSYFNVNIEPKYKINDTDNILPVRIVITNRNEDVTITDFAYKYLFNKEQFEESKISFRAKISNDNLEFKIRKVINSNFTLSALNSYLTNSDYLVNNYDKLLEYNTIYIPIDIFKTKLFNSNLRLNAANFLISNALQVTYCNRTSYLIYKKYNDETITKGQKIDSDNEVIVSKKFIEQYFNEYDYDNILNKSFIYKDIYFSKNKNLYLDLLNLYDILPEVKIVGITDDINVDVIVSDNFYNNLIDKTMYYLDGYIFNNNKDLLREINNYNDKVSLKILMSIYDYNNLFNNKTNIIFKVLSVILSLIAVCSLISFTIVSLKSKYKDIAILLSIGKDKINISLLYLIQIITLGLISLFVSYICGTVVVKMINNYLTSAEFYNVNYNIIVVSNYALLMPFTLVLIVTFVTYSILLFQIFNKKIINLLRYSM